MFRLLRLEFKKIKNFEDPFILDFTASDRIIQEENVSLVSKPIYSQNVMAFVGINASGKTTALRLIKMALSIICDNKSIDQLGAIKDLFSDDSVMVADFFLDRDFYRLSSLFGIHKSGNLIFKDEKIYKKKRKTYRKSDRFSFKEDELFLSRSQFSSSVLSFLKDDDSIVTSLTKDVSCIHLDTLNITNFNFLFSDGPVNPLYLSLLDKSIESIQLTNHQQLDIKFKNSEEIRQLASPIGAELYISSGTIRGSQLLDMASSVLSEGGYLIVDEIENHLNKKLVQLLIDLFQDNEINTIGAVLIFTTHYSELLDYVIRKDSIYVFLKSDSGKCLLSRYSDRIKRNDIKKSDVLLSNFIEGTAPSYEDIQEIKEYMCRQKK